ncbi:Oidioi.mRNA.OKI2018_I69.PAR.g9791.t1.cds [Oikopleura dioica]|uniref:Oidioi.mRNA.OKI2018_I69.PAR.g9791.t1.cds n=1 Tax=Oikopleura dioica TaxID=34765 RepID=A0ABN7RRG9_OIKDI|nr:Oidioi.mRNA.OKI2018_I69.PAR.g9791.t1.cds [Oikopleura dioica]
MKISPFLTILSVSAEAGPLDFWTESDIYAYRVQKSIQKKGIANRFIKKYDQVRDAMRWFQDEGVCDSVVSSPSYEPVGFDAVFDARASPGANIGSLADLLDRWTQSYACIEDPAIFETIQDALVAMKRVAKLKINSDKDVSFHISDYQMSYDQALLYCFSQGMWLADPEDYEQQRGIVRSMTVGNYVWFDSWQAAEGECWVQEYFGGAGPGGKVKYGVSDGPKDCNSKYYAACQSGQTYEKSCTAWPIAKIRVNEQAEAQEYCESAGGNLPFFNDKKELEEWQNRPDPQREWLGIVRSDEFKSGWAKVTGEEATVFAWDGGEPNDVGGDEDCVFTRIDDPLVWNDVPCTSPGTEIFRCRIDSTVYVWEDCPVPEVPEPPTCVDPCEGKEMCTTFVDSCEIYPEKDNVVGTISPTSKYYKISFDFKCTDQVDPELTVPSANVLRLDTLEPGAAYIPRQPLYLEVGTYRDDPLSYWVYGNAVSQEYSSDLIDVLVSKNTPCTTEWDSFTLERSTVDGVNSRSTMTRHSDGALLFDYTQPTADVQEMPPVLYARVSSNIYEPSRLYPVRNYYYEELPEPVTGAFAILHLRGYEKYPDAEYNKIAKLLGDEFVDVPLTLPMRTRTWGQSMTINDNTEALICSLGTCQIFDEESLATTPSYQFGHYYGCMAEYQGNPTLVGGFINGGEPESFIDGNWAALPRPSDPSVEKVYSSACFGLDDGSFLKVGGKPSGADFVKSVWLLREGTWSQLADLPEEFDSYYNMRIGSLYFMAGNGYTGGKIRRMEIEDNTIVSTESIYDSYGMLIPN